VIADDNWHHYAFTWQDGEQRFYIDGQLVLTSNQPGVANPTQLFAVGWLGNRDGEQWSGALADVMTFDRVLTGAEVMSMHNKDTNCLSQPVRSSR